jgi:predicted ATP-dependent endonuclease of OLD family
MRKGKASSTDEIIEPLQLVLVEEPEAHLHVQVQQVFIRKAYSILRNHEKLGTNNLFSTQLVISTHSSHIAREEKFANLRYFKRLPKGFECKVATSKVVNLSDVFGEENDTDKFVTRYLQTTHCDLFFADGAILVEGSAEHMLLPHFIRNKYSKLNQRYISILNINGKHSHRLAPLIDKLALPTLVITDLDSAEPTGHHKMAEPMRKKGLISGNYAITNWIIKKNLLDDLLDLSDDDKVVIKKSVCDYQIRVAYQIPIKVTHLDVEVEALARTFEDSLIYTNWDVLSKLNATDPGQLLKKLIDGFDAKKSFDFLKTTIFNELKKSEVKAEFALDLIFSIAPEEIAVPQYINKGLTWLESVLCTEVN